MKKESLETAGDTALVIFISSLLMAAILVFLKNERLAEYFGNIAYLFLFISVLIRTIYYKFFHQYLFLGHESI